jgi:hypothetical protein
MPINLNIQAQIQKQIQAQKEARLLQEAQEIQKKYDAKFGKSSEEVELAESSSTVESEAAEVELAEAAGPTTAELESIEKSGVVEKMLREDPMANLPKEPNSISTPAKEASTKEAVKELKPKVKSITESLNRLYEEAISGIDVVAAQTPPMIQPTTPLEQQLSQEEADKVNFKQQADAALNPEIKQVQVVEPAPQPMPEVPVAQEAPQPMPEAPVAQEAPQPMPEAPVAQEAPQPMPEVPVAQEAPQPMPAPQTVPRQMTSIVESLDLLYKNTISSFKTKIIEEGIGDFVNENKGKILAGTALAGLGAYAYGDEIADHFKSDPEVKPEPKPEVTPGKSEQDKLNDAIEEHKRRLEREAQLAKETEERVRDEFRQKQLQRENEDALIEKYRKPVEPIPAQPADPIPAQPVDPAPAQPVDPAPAQQNTKPYRGKAPQAIDFVTGKDPVTSLEGSKKYMADVGVDTDRNGKIEKDELQRAIDKKIVSKDNIYVKQLLAGYAKEAKEAAVSANAGMTPDMSAADALSDSGQRKAAGYKNY